MGEWPKIDQLREWPDMRYPIHAKEDWTVCPYCNEMLPAYNYPLSEDCIGEFHTVQCEKCQKDFDMITKQFTATFKRTKDDWDSRKEE